MLVEVARSGLTEAVHEVSVTVVGTDGALVAEDGPVGSPFFLRSTAKPFQASVAQSLGAALVPEHLAVACASHDGDPVHVAVVEAMLADAGLVEADLGCPPAWPLSPPAAARLRAAGHLDPRRIWHTCSGKHAAMLRACLAQGWDPSSYLDEDHPLQRAIAAEMAAVTGGSVGPVGIDGCGAPTFRATTGSLARSFATLATDPGYDDVWTAMHRYPALVSGVAGTETAIAVWLAAAAKRGAEGSMGVAVAGRGGIGLKVRDGSGRPVGPAMLAVLDALGWIPAGTHVRLAALLEVPVIGAGMHVGSVRARPPWT